MKIGVAKRVREGSPELPTRTFSKKQETYVAKVTGGKTTKNSGATMFGGKADVLINNLLSIECKTKTKDSDSISIKKEWLEKLKEERLFDGNPYSTLAFNFGPGQPNYYITDETLFLDFLEYLKTVTLNS